MTWVGDVDIPVISDKETASDVSTVNANFVDENPQSYRLYSELESGSYTVFLNQNIHKKDETLDEQKDALRGMVERHGTEFPISDDFDKGFLLVDFMDYFVTPSEMFDEADITVRFMPYSNYTVGFNLSAFPENDDFDVPQNSYFSVDSSVSVSENGSTVSPDYTYTSADGDINYYEYDSSNFVLSISDFSFERTAPCRLFSLGNRIYSSNKPVESTFELNNSIIKSEFDSDVSTIYQYDSGWSEIGTVSYPHSIGYIDENKNEKISCQSVPSEKTSIMRGFPLIGYTINSRTSFDYNFSLDSIQSQDSYYVSATDTSGNELILVRNEDIGSFSNSSSGLSIDGLSGEEMKVYAGFVPDVFTASDIAQAVYNYGNVKRTFVKNG